MPSPLYTEPDCTLRGKRLCVTSWKMLSSQELGEVVGVQTVLGQAIVPHAWSWSFQMLSLDLLAEAAEDGAEPDGGWAGFYARVCVHDRRRDAWLRQWARDTRVYPLYVAMEGGQLYLLDGHHRLAGAFYYGLGDVAALVGVPEGSTGR